MKTVSASCLDPTKGGKDACQKMKEWLGGSPRSSLTSASAWNEWRSKTAGEGGRRLAGPRLLAAPALALPVRAE